jgi:predicted nucleic acid-binding protein
LICAVNVEEIARGVRGGEEAAVSRLLNALRIAPLGLAEGELAGRWRRGRPPDGLGPLSKHTTKTVSDRPS